MHRKADVFQFDDVHVDVANARVLKSGQPVAVEPKAFSVLTYLLENRGRLVEKEELLKGVWPDTFVTENALTRAIAQLRKALGDSTAKPKYIETVPTRGYRLIAPVQPAADDISRHETNDAAEPAEILLLRPRHWKRVAGIFGAALALALAIFLAWTIDWRVRSTATIRSIAVLPLENLSRDPGQDYFADGMTDALITDLGQIVALRVVSRTSVIRYRGVNKPLPQIGRELGVDAVVEGTVLKSGNQVRITAKLIQAPADKQLWAQSYEGNLRDVLGLQNEVASAIAEQIRIKLTPREQAVLKTARIVNPQAHDLYLRGHYLAETGSIDGFQRSIVYFNQSLEQDPQQALAYAGLAEAYTDLGHMLILPPQQAFPKAKEAALKALQTDDSLSDAHSSLADVKFLFEWDFLGAEREFQRAIELNPNSLDARRDYADLLMAMGRFDESITERKRNQEIGPLALGPHALAMGFYWAHRYDEAIREARKVIAMDPNHWSGHLILGLSLEQEHQFPQAMVELKKAVEVSNDRMWVGFLAHDMALSGDKAGARKILVDLQQLSKRTYVSPWWPAIVYPDLGDKDQAFAWLEECYRGREHDLVFSKVWPMFDSLRSDPRYQNLMRRVGLPQ